MKQDTRVHRGDIIINLWAAEDNPIRKGVYIGNGIVLCAYKGIRKVKYDTRMVQRDTEHFIIIGHAPIDKLFSDMIDKYTNKE